MYDREDFFDVFVHLLDQIRLEPRVVRLGNEDSVFFQCFVDALIEPTLKQWRSRAYRLRRVYDDHIVFIFMFNNMHVAVVYEHFNIRLVQLSGDFRQIFFGVFNDFTVNFDENCFFYSCMFNDFTNDSAIATTDNQNFFGFG